MLDRLSSRRQESEVHPHEWEFRHSSLPRLRTCSRSSNDPPLVPSPLIFRDAAIPYSLTQCSTAPPTFEQYPAPGHVASHLLLVECFHKLKTDVEACIILGNNLQGRNRRLGIELPPSNLSTWTSYLSLAIERFRLWITRIETVVRHSAIFNRYGTGSHLHGAFTENYLPPLDVLLVWYCYLQSPAAYERLIASNDFNLLSQICFPWHILPTSINQETLSYSVPHAAKKLWINLIACPFDLEDCVEQDFDVGLVAFMSAPDELLEITLRQFHLIESFQRYQWLRSPALQGTIQRAMSNYKEQITHVPALGVEITQQIPMDALEARSIHGLELNLPSQLILSTHRAYHCAWQMFAQQNSLKDDETLPPPSYSESESDLIEGEYHVRATSNPELCYCWICERIKDETWSNTRTRTGFDENNIISSPVSPVPSPDDEKRTIVSISSSDSESNDMAPMLQLTKKQIRTIKDDIAIFRNVENSRLKKAAK